MTNEVRIDRTHEPVLVISIARPAVRNAVDGPTARKLHAAFVAFAQDERFKVAILRGDGGHFCAGADLQAIFSDRDRQEEHTEIRSNDLHGDMSAPGPMGPTRLVLRKPVIACIDSHAVAGGLELAAWCDLRVASRDAKLGVLCRLRGVPLIDGGTVRLPQLIGLSRAQDLVLTGRLIGAEEAERIGLVNVVVPSSDPVDTLSAALQLAHTICLHPQECMRGDRLSMLGESDGSSDDDDAADLQLQTKGYKNVTGVQRIAMEREFQHGLRSLQHLGPALEAFINRPRQVKL